MPHLLNRLISRRGYRPQLVYDPTYIYRPWRKWVIGGGILALLALVIFGMIHTEQAETANKSTAPTSVQSSIATIPVSSETKDSKVLYDVIKVVDGDTVDVQIDDKVERLRLIGIDTPETVDPRKTVQCFGKEASDKAKSLLTGAKVQLEADTSQDNRDKYDRLLRYVYLEDGTNFNEYMIAQGFAHEYTYNLPYTHQQAFKAAEKAARDGNKGLWSSSTCSGNTTGAASSPKAAQVPSAAPASSTATQSSGNCDPNYSPCVPKVSYDLDCADIGFSVRVIGTDIHRFDRDRDGYGCESY